jgi:catechol 2,3-dioxygenase
MAGGSRTAQQSAKQAPPRLPPSAKGDTKMSKQNGQIPQPVLHHVNLKTTRMREMIDWYGTVVGTKPNFHFPAGAWLTNDGANHRIALITSSKMSDDPQKLEHTGIHHMAFEYTSCDELLDNYVRLKALGIVPHMSLDHGMTMSFYYVDPDGNSVELQYDNFGDWQASSEWMRTSAEFAANPIGVPVDPAKLVEARDQGASSADLHRRAFTGEFQPQGPLDLRIPLD